MPPQTSGILRRRSLETASVWALIGTLIIAVLIVSPAASVPFAPTKAFVLAAGALITLALYILARLARGNVILPPFALVGALWLPALAYALSAAFSGGSFANALWGTALEPDTLGFLLLAAALGTLAALALRRADQYRSFFIAAAWTFGALVVIELLVIIVGQVSPATISPAFSIVGSSENLALLLGLGVVSLLLAFRFLSLGHRTRRQLLILSALALALLAVLDSSLVWTLVALVALGLFVEAVMQRRSNASDGDLDDMTIVGESSSSHEGGNHSLIVPLVALAVALFFLVGGNLGGAAANALHVNVLNVRPSWKATLAVAQKTYSTAPVFGTGPGSFETDWLKYRDASLNATIFWNVDFSSGIGALPTSFVTTGLVGATAWLALLALLIVLGLRMLILRAPKDAFTRAVAIISFVAALYLFAAALFDLPTTTVFVLAFVFTGIFASTTRFATERQWGVVFSRSPRLGFIIVFALTLILLASVVGAYSLVERYSASVALTQATNALSAGNLDAADQYAQNAIAFAPSADGYQLQARVANARLSAIVASSTMAVAAAQQAFQTALSSGINAALTATRLAPGDYQNWLALGNLYAAAVPLKVSGAYDSAKTAYDKAQALDPTNPQIPYILAQLDIANGDNKSAENDLATAITLKQDYTDAIFLLSQLEVQDGDVKDALTSAQAAAYFTPGDPNIQFQVGILEAASNNLSAAAAALEASVAANSQFANARYFLAAVYAKQGNLTGALAQLEAIAALSDANAKAVATQITALKAGENPFPANLLSAPSTPVAQ